MDGYFQGLAHAIVGAGKCEIREQASKLKIQGRVDIAVFSPKSTGQARQSGNASRVSMLQS